MFQLPAPLGSFSEDSSMLILRKIAYYLLRSAKSINASILAMLSYQFKIIVTLLLLLLLLVSFIGKVRHCKLVNLHQTFETFPNSRC